MCISSAAVAAFHHPRFLAVLGHIGQKLAGFVIVDHGAQRHFYDDILCIFTKHFFSAAIFALFRSEFAMTAEIDQRIQIAIGPHDDRAPQAAIAARWAASWHIFLAAESNHPIAAGAGYYNNFCSINEHIYLIYVNDNLQIIYSIIQTLTLSVMYDF